MWDEDMILAWQEVQEDMILARQEAHEDCSGDCCHCYYADLCDMCDDEGVM